MEHIPNEKLCRILNILKGYYKQRNPELLTHFNLLLSAAKERFADRLNDPEIVEIITQLEHTIIIIKNVFDKPDVENQSDSSSDDDDSDDIIPAA